MKSIILASVSVMAIAAAPGYARTSSDSAQTTPAENAPQGAAPGAVEADGLQDIIVTAQRIEQNAQKAPLAISVVAPEELTRQNIIRAEDLSRAVPSLIAANSGGANTTFFLRGVGNFTVNSYSDPSIAFNYDGVYIGRPTSTSGVFYDLQRVEVLKGPQGTLYGRNATGGAINVIPNRPKPGMTSAEIQASYGNYDAIQTQGAINLPIGDTGAFRLSGTYNKHDGYLSDGTSDQDEVGVRAQALAELTPDLTTRVAADYSHAGGVGTGAFRYGTIALTGTGYAFTRAPGFDPSIGLHDPRSEAFLQTRFVGQAGRLSEPLNSYPSMNNGFWGVTSETNWQTSAGTLTVQAAYRETDINTLFTAPDFRANTTEEHDDQVSVEARFAGKVGDKIDYLVGAYYFDENIQSSVAINQLTLTPFQDLKTGTVSKAGFGRLTFHATDTLTFTAAGRYTSDRKKFDGVSDNFVLFCGNPAPPQDFCPTLPLEPIVRNAAQLRAYYLSRGIRVSTVPFGPAGLLPPNTPSVLEAIIPINATTKTNKFTYRLAADFQVGPSSLLYASYETGFHGGGFSFARGLESYEPETIGAYTIGSKNRFFDNRLQVNIEGFYWKYKNQQFSQFGFDLGTPPATVFYTSNVGASTNKGVDIDVDFLLTPTTRIGGSLQYLSARYDNFITYAPNQGTPPNTACPFTPVVYRGTASFAVDCSGRPAFNAPKWSFNLNAQQTLIVGGYRVVVQGGTRYRGDYFVAPTYQPWLISKAGFQSDATVTFSPATDNWFFSGFINNIESERRIVQASTNSGLGTVTGNTTAPRSFGLRVGGRFR